MTYARLLSLATALFMLFGAAETAAQCNPCMSAGVKIGHSFGDNGGFTWGLELSISQWNYENRGAGMIGAVLAWDMIGAQDLSRLHFGLQGGGVYSVGSAGAVAGPTLLFQKGEPVRAGVTLTPFLGVFTAHPYYSLTLAPGRTYEELGLIAKAPFVFDPINL